MKYITFSIFVIAILIGTTVSVHAQSGGGYELTWWTIDGGGTANNGGGGYSLAGTIGQPDAGASSASGYTLTGGFWGGAMLQYKVYLPIVLR